MCVCVCVCVFVLHSICIVKQVKLKGKRGKTVVVFPGSMLTRGDRSRTGTCCLYSGPNVPQGDRVPSAPLRSLSAVLIRQSVFSAHTVQQLPLSPSPPSHLLFFFMSVCVCVFVCACMCVCMCVCVSVCFISHFLFLLFHSTAQFVLRTHDTHTLLPLSLSLSLSHTHTDASAHRRTRPC